MNTGVIDTFLNVFTQYIDTGFGLLRPEVAYIATTLIVIDVTLAALFWSWAGDEDIVARLVKKTLFVGVFAYLIGNWGSLSRTVFESFAGLGLKASGTGLSEADFLRPGRIAQVGLDAGQPILQSLSGLMGFASLFENFIQVIVLLFAWVIVLISFFVLAIQLFVSLIEFKLATLAGFVLIPFGLFGKTAFAAERVLGLVLSSGVKVLVLAVVVGIGSTLFTQFTSGFPATPTIQDAMGLCLAALSLLGLGIFAPSVANGIVSGGPQLGAGAAVGTGLAAGGVVAAGVGAASLAAGGGVAALAGVARGGASLAGASVGAFRTGALGAESAGGAAAGGLGGMAKAAGGAASAPLKRAASDLGAKFRSGARAGFEATGGSIKGGASASASTAASAASSGSSSAAPAWAQRLRQGQAVDRGVTSATHAVRSGDAAGGGASVDLSESER